MAATGASPDGPRLRRVGLLRPGDPPRRHGRGFSYLDDDGKPVTDAEVLARIHELVIPPAWQDVWICPYPGGHIQADRHRRGRAASSTSTTSAGASAATRRSSTTWSASPARCRALRKRVERPRLGDELSASASCVAVRLLDRGFFRIGSEDYAVATTPTGWRR